MTTALVPLLLACGILSPMVYVAGDVLAARLYPGYSYADQAVSELFAIGAPTKSLVVFLFSVSSALLLGFAIGVWWRFERSRLRRLIAIMFVCTAIDSLVLWNFFPMHMRGAKLTFTDTMHLVLAANPFWLLALIFGAVAFHGWFRAYTIATMLVLLVLGAFGFSYAPAIAANEPTPWMGLAERGAQYGHGVWQMVLALVLWREYGRRVGA